MNRLHSTPRYIAVVVPARDEEAHIAACLGAVQRAIRQLQCDSPNVVCEIFVVLDRCTDGTGTVAAAAGACTVRTDAGRVGTARRLGVERARRCARRRGFAPEDVWIACTDADTEVPGAWLSGQLSFGACGIDMVVGTVTPTELDPARARLWRANHSLAEGHSHVHGANLGIRLSAYLAAGGFADVTVHEDLDLVTRVRAATDDWVATHRTSVRTSGRSESRVNGGFASYLAELGPEDSSCAS